MSLYIATRKDYGRSAWPNRPISAHVIMDDQITIRESDGSKRTIPTYQVVTIEPDGFESRLVVGVQLSTAKFVADCAAGIFNER
jgi:hypothetical protein